MSLYIVLQCDAPQNSCSPKCYSRDGLDLLVMCRNTNTSVLSGMKYLRDTAMKNGWTTSDGRWLCPACGGE